MSLDFYDAKGRPYAYCDDGESIYTFAGRPIAYIDGDSIFAFSGRHIGYFEEGALRDAAGHTLLFTDGARSGPIKPIKQIRPMKGGKGLRPVKRMQQNKPIKPIKTLSWSAAAPEKVLEV